MAMDRSVLASMRTLVRERHRLPDPPAGWAPPEPTPIATVPVEPSVEPASSPMQVCEPARVGPVRRTGLRPLLQADVVEAPVVPEGSAERGEVAEPPDALAAPASDGWSPDETIHGLVQALIRMRELSTAAPTSPVDHARPGVLAA